MCFSIITYVTSSKLSTAGKISIIICNVCDYLGEIASNQNHSLNAKIKIAYGNHNRQLLSYQLSSGLSSTINNEVINMYPTGQKIGINSVENTFFGEQNIFFFLRIQKQFIYYEQNEKDFIYFHIFLNPPPPPPQLSNGPPLNLDLKSVLR